MSENYIDKIILSTLDSMSKNDWDWPAHWDTKIQHNFLNECLSWLETNEYYEYCDVIKNEKEKIQKEK